MRTLFTLLSFAVLAGCSASNNLNLGSGSPASGSAATGSATSSTSGATSGASASGSGTGSGGATGSGSGGATGSGSGGATGSSASGGGGDHPFPNGSGGAGSGSGSVSSSASASAGSGGSPVEAAVYGHTPDTLYKLDPNTKAVTKVGPFIGCDADIESVIDMAIDKDGNMYVTTFAGFYKVDKDTATCTLIAVGGAYPNSLSFVPAGTIDPNAETLVGYKTATYVSIDTTTGAMKTVGSLGKMGYVSSGDIVSVIGGGTYLTVQDGPQNCADCLVEVDPTTGAFKQLIGGQLGYSDVYGIAFWGGIVYGFDDSGDLFQVDLTTGATTAIPIPNAPPGLVWYGAASTTAAPLTGN